jgi:hypothetical protein
MQEDEIGLRRAVGQDIFVQCSRCGRSIPKREATPAPADALEDDTGYDVLCPTCRDELAAGEQDLPLATD